MTIRPLALPALLAAAGLVIQPTAVSFDVAGGAMAAAPRIAPVGGGLLAGYLGGLLGIGGALVTMPLLYAVPLALGVTLALAGLRDKVPVLVFGRDRQHVVAVAESLADASLTGVWVVTA